MNDLRKEFKEERRREREYGRAKVKELTEKTKDMALDEIIGSACSEVVHFKLNIPGFKMMRERSGSANWFAMMMRMGDTGNGIELKSRWTFKLQRQLESGEMKYISPSLQERLIKYFADSNGLLTGEPVPAIFENFMYNWLFIVDDTIQNKI